ncbi:MAG TPA: ribonuclease P protein component [Candidatus Kapabacteria bacterium]|nr:ribonuclease P protein component [Candidatus Kapabacteria bacterium]
MNDAAGQRIRRDERLRSRECINRIFETGYSARTGKVLARFIFGDKRPIPMRFGFAAGRAIGNAVARNRCKRVMREAVRLEKNTRSERLRRMRRSADIMFIWTGAAADLHRPALPELRRSMGDVLDAVVAKAALNDESVAQ